MEKKKNVFNTIIYDPNGKKFEAYDVMPYLRDRYLNEKKKRGKNRHLPETFEEFKAFVREWGMYQFWGRCEYEVILVDWPCQNTSRKIDVWEQINANIDIVTELLMKDVVKKKLG